MKYWPTKSLGELVDFIGGGTPRRNRPDYWGGDIPWASVKDLQGPSIEETIEYITSEGLANSASNLIPAGTVIIASRVGLGKVAINRKPMAINQDLKALTPRSAELSPRYLLLFLQSEGPNLARAGVGTTVKGLTLADYQQLQIQVPPPAEQKRLVMLVDEADALRKLRAQAHRRTADLVSALFQKIFLEDKSHVLCSLVEICSEIYRYPTYYGIKYVESGVPEIRGELLNDDFSIEQSPQKLRFISQATSSRFPRTQLSEGDLVMSVRGTIGKLALVPKTLKGANITANLLRIAPRRNVINGEYLLYFLVHGGGLAKIASFSASTTI